MKKEIDFYNKVMQHWFDKNTTHRLRKQVKFISRNLFCYSEAKEIANFVMEHPYLSRYIYDYPMLCSKLHKPYMTYILGNREKIEILFSSYRYLDRYFSKETLERLYREKQIKILEISGKSGECLTAYFRIFTNYDKEGEFNLHLYQGENLLATLTFSIWKRILFIGGLQGLGRNNNDPEILKAVTKDFYGIFPKRLLIEIFYHLFPEDKMAVGNQNHIYLAQRYRYKAERKVKADYDEFWESLGAKQRENGLWSLPKSLVRKSMEEIPSKKRSQYRSRYELLDRLEILVSEFLEHTKQSGS